MRHEAGGIGIALSKLPAACLGDLEAPKRGVAAVAANKPSALALVLAIVHETLASSQGPVVSVLVLVILLVVVSKR